MKRTLLALVSLLLFLLTAGDASARLVRKKRAPKPPREVLVERETAEAREKAERVTAELPRERKTSGSSVETDDSDRDKSRKPIRTGPPVEKKLTKARGKKFDLRTLPSTKPKRRPERPEREGPPFNPVLVEEQSKSAPEAGTDAVRLPAVEAAAPAPIITFDGLDRENWGAGSPPDTTGDVGPVYYIQAVNTSVGVYRKSDGFREAAFTFDTLMSQGNFGNQCDDQNFGDPVVLYDTFEDRWILSDFAFTLDGGGNVNPPIAYQCFAVSMTGDPVAGGWNFYSIEVTDGLNDYPKLAVWTDGIYMSANVFGYPSGAPFQSSRAWAFNKAQMYAGSPTVQIVQFDLGASDFTVVPSNARLQTGTPPAGRPNLFISTSNFLNALSVYKFHVDWNSISLSTFTGPDIPISATSWPNSLPANVPQSGTAQLLDTLSNRAMVQHQYTNIGGTESLWIPHTVRRGNTTGFAAPRWYEVNVTGGTVAAAIPQAATWDPDASNVMHRWMPSLAVDRGGNMAILYSTSSSTTFPSIKYAGRLATDPVNTFSQTEQTLLAGTASQTSSGRWGDYATLMLDPDGCTFWGSTQYANPVAQTFDKRWLTRIGSFRYPECTAVGAGGTISGTVIATAGGTPISGATVTLGARSTTTDGSGVYSFTALPAGTYPSMTASAPGYVTGSAANIAVTDGGTTTQDFSLGLAPTNACPADTTQADFQAGVATNVDVTTVPGDVMLSNPATIDQQNTTLGTQGAGTTFVTWLGQTFTAAIAAPVVRVDVNMFSLNCGAVTMPNLVISIRNAAGNLPTGADLAVSDPIPGFCNGGGGWFTATFPTPVTLTPGTQYALVIRPAAAIPAGAPAPGYFWSVSVGTGAIALQNPYAGGRRASSANSGVTWAGAAGNANNDHGFKIYVDQGYTLAGNLVSSTKDSNAPPGLTPVWGALTWTATTPADTSVQFQAAASNSVNGPFAFVGPDGTAATFFTTSGASLDQFFGKRYLQYKAYLATTVGTATPTLHDVQVCYVDTDCSGTLATITPTPAQVCYSSAGNTAAGPADATAFQWSIANGTIVGSPTSETVTYTAGASGTVDLSLAITAANGCHVSSTLNIPIVTVATPTVTPGGPATFCAGESLLLTSIAADSYQWYLDGSPIGGETSQTLTAFDAGDYTVIVMENGCASAPSSAMTITVTPLPATPTITPGGPTTFCDGDSVTLSSSAASGNQWYLDGGPIGGATTQDYIATEDGDYTVVVTANGCDSPPSSPTAVTVNPIPAAPSITPDGPVTFCTGGSVTLESSSAAGNQWYLDGETIVGATGQQHVALVAGVYTVSLTENGCESLPSDPVTVTINPIPQTPEITPGGPTTFCDGDSVTLTSSSAAGNQWHLGGNPIGGATAQQYVATAAGDYTVVVTENACPSAASTAVSVTVNSTPTPTITPGGPTTFCTGGSVTLTSSSATNNQWYLNGGLLGGETNQTYIATGSGDYTVIVTENSCPSAPSAATTVTVNPIPATPTITPGGPTTFCDGGSVTLTSSSASGNQWYLGGNPIDGATAQQYVATDDGDYTVVVTETGCASAPSSATAVTVTPLPATPTITPGGPTTFCTGGSVTLTSSSASGNQWYLAGNPIGGATAQEYVATSTGSYTVVVTATGCASAPSSATAVTVTPLPATPTITPDGPTSFCYGDSVTLTSSSASGNQWFYEGAEIPGATGQQHIVTTYTGDYTVVVTQNGCSSAPSAATAVTINYTPAAPAITPDGPTTFCAGDSVTLISGEENGNQWYRDGTPIEGATNQAYIATASGSYTVTRTQTGCTSAQSAATVLTVNPIPATPAIGTGGPTTFCTSGSVTLTSSSASGNQWYLGGNPIGGATAQQYVATAAGDYTVLVTQSGCSGSASAATTVTVNPTPSAPTITPGGPTTFCAGGSVTLTSSSASGNQWYLDGNPIGGATGQQYPATVTGSYTVTQTASGCASAHSSATTVTVNPIPPTPIVTPGGPTTFCDGGSVTLTSNYESGNQWLLDGIPIGGATAQQYVATATGYYAVFVTVSGCASAASSAIAVTVDTPPSTPVITPNGPTTFCTGGSVTLSSSSASGNQWLLNGAPIDGEKNQTLLVSAAGDYAVAVTAGSCTTPSAVTTVTVNPNPNATITAPASVVSGSTANTASVANAGVGATYNWSIGNGSITAGVGTSNITFTAGAAGSVTLDVTVTTAAGCPDAGSASVTITAAPPAVTVTSVTPNSGSSLGGTPVTIAGTGFLSGAAVTFGGSSATSVVVVNATQLTAVTPAHAAGAVNVVVTNTNATAGTLTNGYTYSQQNFDPNGDSVIDPSDIFYLVAYLFLGGPPPAGVAGMPSGDANGDGVIDPSDIFYVVNYLFGGGPAPHARTARETATASVGPRLAGSLSLGAAARRGDRWFVPVIVTMDAGSPVPQSLSLRVAFRGETDAVAMHRGAGLEPAFEISRRNADAIAYLVSFNDKAPLVLGNSRSATIAEIEVSAPGAVRMDVDASLTMLVGSDGASKATVANRMLRVNGTTIDGRDGAAPRGRTNQQ
ncbi:MAG TPA: carboxypeptidase regulatory-like domain-containing protein [Thermoanaerobaculia bacterium]|nr:carboxypeptidase regulatory-like domain-containing protein [Thermoanaerobaculia bacterium]